MTTSTALCLAVMFLGSLMALVGRSTLRTISLLAFPVALIALLVGLDQDAGSWWRVDRVGAALAMAALVIGACACRYAQRQFEGEHRGGLILAASFLVVTGVIATDLAVNQVALILSWVGTSLATLLLLRAGAGSWRSGVVRHAAATFAIVDSALVVGVLVAGTLPGHIALTAPLTGAAGLGGAAAGVVLAVAALAAAGRAGLTTQSSWVTATISTPTSISALLHAGVVNAGALLLLRIQVAGGSRWWFAAALGVTCAVVLVALAPRIDARVDLKGQLAASTISQMAFMLMAIALGWPILALTHLIGHGLYKAGRFMASGGAIESRAQLRKRRPTGVRLDRTLRVAGVVTILAVAAMTGIVIGSDALTAMGVIGPGAAMVWWVRTNRPLESPLVSWLSLGVGLVLYGALIGGATSWLGSSMPHGTWQAPWWSLGAVVGLVAMVTASRRRRPAPSAAIPTTSNMTHTQITEVAA